jgi:hypothetical protein
VQYQSNPSSKQIIFRPTYEGKLVKRDVGVIIKCTNPENSTRGCLMLFGMRTYGVEAAAKAFVSKLTGLTRVWPKRYFCVVESDVLNHAVGDPRVLVYKTF